MLSIHLMMMIFSCLKILLLPHAHCKAAGDQVGLLQVGGVDVYLKVQNDIECLVLLHVSRSWFGPDHLLPWSDGALLFGNTQSYSFGLHLKGAAVLSDFSPLETVGGGGVVVALRE